jgi:hypothetical protein
MEPARDVARALAKTETFEQSRRERKRVEMLFAHLKRIPLARPAALAGAKGRPVRVQPLRLSHRLRRVAKLTARSPPAAQACFA